MKETVPQSFISLIRLIPEIDADYAIEVIGGSEFLYEKILMSIVQMMPYNIEQMDKSLIIANSLQDFAVKVHGVKSSLKQAGYTRLVRDAEALENAAKSGEMSYCTENYGCLREYLIKFCNRVNAAVAQSAGADANAETENESSDIKDFLDILIKVKTAAEEYDTITASELLLPLTKRRFGESTDILLAKAFEALKVFKPGPAQDFITELIKEHMKRNGENS